MEGFVVVDHDRRCLRIISRDDHVMITGYDMILLQTDRQSEILMLVSHCGEYPCECKKYIFAANSPDSGEYKANGLTNAIRHQSQ